MSIAILSNEKLLSQLKSLRHQERELVTDILKYLLEVEARQLHLEQGFSSLYSFCTEELGYSEDEAYIRIQAMRCLKAVPKIEEEIESGHLSLSVVAKAQTVFKRQAKLKKPLNVQQKTEVIEGLFNVSVRQAEKKLAAQFPEADLVREKIKPITEELTKIEFTANQKLMQKLEKLKHLLAHKNFDGRMDGLIGELADIALKKLESKASSEIPKSVSHVELTRSEDESHAVLMDGAISVAQRKSSRYISQVIRRAVWQKADAQCQFQNSSTGQRCSSRHGLQIDHIHEFSRGGASEITNLQLLCGAPHRWKSS